jgi:Zn-dependent M28 family amino/carboxypeptidase
MSARVLVLAGAVAGCSFWMPGASYDGPPPPLSDEDEAIRERLRAHVVTLATQIGERNWPHYDGLERARDYVAGELQAAGLVTAMRPFAHRGETFHNVEAVFPGAAPSIACIVVGAHYDTVEGSPGANDNGSGVATLIELARAVRERQVSAPVRFVAFANEEPPYFNTGDGMGSVAYAGSFADPPHEVRAMLSLETVGFYSDEPGSQRYPPLVGMLYPDRGDFIAFVGNVRSRSLVRSVVASFRRVATLPSEGAALPAFVPGVSWSDHRSFWDVGVPAVMVTDTAPFRDAHYHRASDTPEHLDYARMTRLVTGLTEVVLTLAKGDPR